MSALERDAEAAFQHAENAASMRRWSVAIEAIESKNIAAEDEIVPHLSIFNPAVGDGIPVGILKD